MSGLRGLVIVLLALTSVARAAQDIDAAALGAAIDKARSEQVDALAPTNFAAAVEAQQAAVKDAAKGRKTDKVSAKVQEGEAALSRATTAAAGARQLLGSVLKAREDALAAQAPKFAGQSWEKAAERFREAMTANEKNDTKNAQKRAAEAEVLLRDAELIAIKGGVLDEARAMIAQADEAKVAKFAPRSLQAAKRYLAQAEQEIQRNRYEMSEPRKLAAQARYEARHATYLAQLIERTLKEESDDQAGVEALILSWEEPLKRIATEMELSAQFDKGMQATMQEINEHAATQAQEARRLKQELADRDENAAALNTQLQKLESRLGGVSEERVALQRRVDAQERLRSSVAALEATFSPDDARVVRQGDDVVLSLLGIKFPSGKSTIDASSAALMKKVQQGLALFPGASVSVEGHTDANGSDSQNLILSQDRADAVRQYMVSNFGFNPEKVSSVGYGEARPVATNETAAGRARNRRIDLVIHPEQR
ncbi:MAG TPA: OmpA family protein [Steroidobacteraceae bacterium]|nr:OmpA family protein [Steroidobacteraceae bacterium]